MARRVAIGTVTSDKMQKTRRVELPRSYQHPKYGKIIRTATICFVHDEAEESAEGDTVEIRECAPLSKKKRWEMVRVVAKSQAVDVAALRAAAKQQQAAEEAAAGDA